MQTLPETIEAFIEDRRSRKRASDTIKYYKHNLSLFVNSLESPSAPLVDNLTTRAIRYHLAICPTISTAAAAWRALHAFCSWCETEPKIENPHPFYNGRHLIVLKPTQAEKEPRVVPVEHVVKLLQSIKKRDWIDARDTAIISLLFATGMRRIELCRMTMTDLRLTQKWVVAKGKGRKERPIPLTEKAAVALLTYVYERPVTTSNALFLAATGHRNPKGPLTRGGLTEMLRRRCLAAGLPIYRSHAYRHRLATSMLNLTGDMDAVKRLLGHADTRTTEQYARWAIEGLQAWFEQGAVVIDDVLNAASI